MEPSSSPTLLLRSVRTRYEYVLVRATAEGLKYTLEGDDFAPITVTSEVLPQHANRFVVHFNNITSPTGRVQGAARKLPVGGSGINRRAVSQNLCLLAGRAQLLRFGAAGVRREKPIIVLPHLIHL